MTLADPCRVILFFFYPPADPRHLHSFPTRRSSDLACVSKDGAPKFYSLRASCSFNAASAAPRERDRPDRKSTRLNSSHLGISYAVFCLKKKTSGTLPRKGSRDAPARHRRHVTAHGQ